MPFTPAHTAAVLPFLRRHRLSGTALVAGSMSPDFEYFIRMDIVDIWGAGLKGILLFDLPITLVLVVLFHLIVKRNLINNLPPLFQKRLSHLKELSLRDDVFSRPLTFLMCAALGTFTHIGWDAFTHAEGFFVQRMHWLYDGRYVLYEKVQYPLWYALQNISTGIGLTLVLIYVLMMRPSGYVVRPTIWYWPGVLSVAAIMVAVRYQFPHPIGFPMFVIATVSGLCAGVILLGLFPGKEEIASR